MNFEPFERNSHENTKRVLNAFRKYRVSDAFFAGTTGYGYNDAGRDALESVFAEVFGAEKALVRTQFVSGTHAIACALFGTLKSGQTLLSAAGEPYDTLRGVISGQSGSLEEYGVKYRELPLLADGTPDIKGLAAAAKTADTVFIQRSRGYAMRPAIGIDMLTEMIDCVRKANDNAVIFVDNCYCEFVGTVEPCMVGADLTAGSLIKNPGGGLAPTGGYIAGRKDLVCRAAARLTAPGIGGECGATLGVNRLLFQGFFNAPHAVCEALKTVEYAASRLETLGYETAPHSGSERADIIQMLCLKNPEKLLKFCKEIQAASPVDSFVTPVPWAMPGYGCDVIMAAGTFVQGGSLELSCDAPMREPFSVFLQGGLTFESGKFAVDAAVAEL